MTDQYRASLASLSGDSFAQSIEELRATAALHHLSTMNPSGVSTPNSARPVRSSSRKIVPPNRTPGTPTPAGNASGYATPQTSSYYPQQHYYNQNASGASGYAGQTTQYPFNSLATGMPTQPATSGSGLSLPIPTTPQARLTSYASRLRTGATLLVQPILSPSASIAVAPATSFIAASNSAMGIGASSRAGRARAAVNYSEDQSADEFEDDSGDEDFSGPRREAAAKRKAAQMAANAAALAGASNELDQSYLGMQPPARFITSRLMAPVKYEHHVRDVVDTAAKRPELLVPIRVEVDTDSQRIRDCFTWNLNEDLVTPKLFAEMFCADLDLPEVHVETIVNMIRAQLDEHSGVVTMDVNPLDDELEPEDPDCRVILKLDVQLDNYHLVDHIEWDLCSMPATPETTPEAFAKQLCADLGLRGEAVPIVSHALHEELVKHKKDAIEWGVLGGLAGGASVEDGGYRRNQRGPRRLKGVWRDWVEFRDYGPRMEILTPEDLEKKEMERERASRRMRRETSKFQRNAGSYYRDNRAPRPSRLR